VEFKIFISTVCEFVVEIKYIIDYYDKPRKYQDIGICVFEMTSLFKYPRVQNK
jgi:hypothetical protein